MKRLVTPVVDVRYQRGYLLLAVSLGLIVLSMFAYTALEVGQGEAQLRGSNASATSARYAAQAGVAKAHWQLAQTGVCNGYPQKTTTSFNGFGVTSAISPLAGSPVSIISSATNSSGVTVDVQRELVPVMRTSETVVISAQSLVDDTYVQGDEPDRKEGDKRDLKVGIALPRISLLKFDLLTVPLNARVLSATLELNYKSATQVDPGALLSVFAMQEPWMEASATFNENGNGESWSWPQAYDGSDQVDQLDLSAASVGALEFDVTRLARAWVSGERANHGLALAAVDGVLTNVKFSSSDENSADKRPKLTVTYACECGVVCSLGGESPVVMMFVSNFLSLEAKDEDRVALLEDMGFSVILIDDDSFSVVIEAAAAVASVAYVSSTVNASALLGNLQNLSIGIVSEQAELLNEVGFSNMYSVLELDGVTIADVSHYITAGFIAGAYVELTADTEDYHVLQGSIAAGAQSLATEQSASALPSLAVLDVGAIRADGSSSIARRVNLPWAATDDNFDVDNLTSQGRSILRRSLEWAAAGGGGYLGYHDNFVHKTCVSDPDYQGSVGQEDWSEHAWVEGADDGFSCTGSIRLASDPDYPAAGNNRLLVAGNAEMSRVVDTSGFTSAYVGFRFRRSGTAASEELRLYGSTDGLFYDLIGAVSGDGGDATYSGVFADFTPYISATMHFKLEGVGLSESAHFFIDDVSVTESPP